MLEIRYKKATGELTGWWGSRHGNHDAKLKNRPGEAIVLLELAIPMFEPGAYLFNGVDDLIENTDYIDTPTETFQEEVRRRLSALEQRQL